MVWLWKLSELSIRNLLLKQSHQHNSWFLCILFPGVGWGIFRPSLEKTAWSQQSLSDQADCWELHWQLLGKSEIYSSCVSCFDTWAEPSDPWWWLSTEYTERTHKCWSQTKLIVLLVFSTIHHLLRNAEHGWVMLTSVSQGCSVYLMVRSRYF